MTEQEFTSSIQRALNESATHLPYKVSHRLAQSRQAALAKYSAQPAIAMQSVLVGGISSGNELPYWRQGLNLAFPVIVVAVALYAISATRDSAEVDATAEIDRAVLLDELPISTYTDYGYGVFLKNSRQ
jgi:Protein of unknown function (DUF3619)